LPAKGALDDGDSALDAGQRLELLASAWRVRSIGGDQPDPDLIAKPQVGALNPFDILVSGWIG
jgi:hypothetical protein